MAEPIRGQAYEFPISLIDLLDPISFVVNPTLEAADFRISKDFGPFNPLFILPVVSPGGSSNVKISLNATEMTADKIVIKGKDVNGDQWGDFVAFIDAPVGNFESVLDIIEGDHRESSTNLKIFKKGTGTIILEKDIAGSLLQTDIVVTTTEP